MKVVTRFVLPAVVVVGLVAAGIIFGKPPPSDRPGASGTGSPQAGPSAHTSAPSGHPSPPPPTHAGPAPKSVRLTVLPAISQPGAAPAAAGSASMVFTARVRPSSAGGTVLLERRAGDGWRTVARASEDATGKALFADVPASGQVAASRYRATALTPDGTPGPVSNQVSAGDWRTIFADDFGGTALDTSKWDYRQAGIYNPAGSRQCSKSEPSTVSVRGGVVRLQMREDPARVGERCVTPDYGTFGYYLNAQISTERSFSFTYGVAAARIKYEKPRGQHGAFWMQHGPAQQVPGNAKVSGSEIDVTEFFGKGYPHGGLASQVYYLDKSNENTKLGSLLPRATRRLPPGDAWWRRYHVFSVQWTPKDYVFRVDGNVVDRIGRGVSGVNEYLILSLLSSDWELGQLDRSTLPTTMDVDWVRVWQHAG